jgi:hypothetical protein
MWKFVRADKAQLALSAQTNFHIQKYGGLKKQREPAMEVKL